MSCLKSTVITSTGTLPHRSDQLRKWVEANKGRWVTSVSKNTTHLICSKEAWRRGVDAVAKAQELAVHIVSYDWLEDSLHKKRRLSEKKYTWEYLDKARRKKKRMRRVAEVYDRSAWKKGCERAERDLGSGKSNPEKGRKGNALGPRNKNARARPQPESFFRSSLQELRERREARERAEKTGREGSEREGPAEKETVMDDVVSETEETHEGQDAQSDDADMGDADAAEPSEAEQSANEEAKDSPSTRDIVTESTDESQAEEDDQEHVKWEQGLPTRAPSQARAYPSPASSPFSRSPTKSPNADLSDTVPAPAPCVPQPKTERLTDNYHVYMDTTGFHYDIQLLRINNRGGFAKYTIRLFESHTKPHVYCTVVRYIPAPERPNAIEEEVKVEVVKNKLGVPIFANGWKEEDPKQKSKGKAKPKPKANGKLNTEPHTLNVHNHSVLLANGPKPDVNDNSTGSTPREEPYRGLLVPLNSDFATAFSAFTSAFMELTFLPWDLRFHPQAREFQKYHAWSCKIEPFTYQKPDPAQPMGVLPAVPLLEDSANIGKRFDVQRVRRFNLPGMQVPLSEEFSLGQEIMREAERERKRLEAVERERMQREREEKVKKQIVTKEEKPRVQYRRPWFSSQYQSGYL